MDRGKVAMITATALLIVAQLNSSAVTAAAVSSEISGNNSDHNNNQSVTPSVETITMAPINLETDMVQSFTEMPLETTHRSTIANNPIFSSLREKNDGPETCGKYEISPEQPTFNNSTWNKCCPVGKTLIGRDCEDSKELIKEYHPPIINATFYSTECIEDSEVIDFIMTPVIRMPQNQSLYYDEIMYGDHLYILQNGSLLIVFDNMMSGYGVYDEYCLDLNPETHSFFALVYTTDLEKQIVTGIILDKFYKGIALIMTISFCCLIITSALYLLVPRFGTLHGRSFALHTMNLALGYVITASMYYKWDGNTSMTGNDYLQYFVSAAFMWQLTMCIDTVINVWYYIPKNISPIEGRYRGWIHFAAYVIFSQTIPFLFIIRKDESDTPVSYYMSTLGETNHGGQWRFFGPILFIVVLCCGLFAVIYYGFRKLNSIQSFAYIIRMKLRKQKREEIEMPFCSKEMEYVKDAAKATFFLFAIQSLCFISEVISFYTANDSSIFFELMNALQGVFILVLFVLFPKPMQIIRQCWAGDQGSLVIEQSPRRTPARTREEIPLNAGDEEKA